MCVDVCVWCVCVCVRAPTQRFKFECEPTMYDLCFDLRVKSIYISHSTGRHALWASPLNPVALLCPEANNREEYLFVQYP